MCSNNDDTVRAFDAETFQLTSQLHLPWAVNCTVVQPGGCRLLLTVGDDPAAHVYEAASGRQVRAGRRRLQARRRRGCRGRPAGAGARLLVLECAHLGAPRRPARPAPLAQVLQLRGHMDYSFAAAWHPDGNVVATGNQVGHQGWGRSRGLQAALLCLIKRCRPSSTRLGLHIGSQRGSPLPPLPCHTCTTPGTPHRT